ncbi:hypothetical protein SEA_FRANCOB_105 [Streptomyces phage Francob]
MFMYNDVTVHYSQRVENEYTNIYDDSYWSSKGVLSMSRVVHILEVRSLDTSATVSCETGYGFSRAVVISTLLAALRNIDDGFIYSLARKKVESQMGFEVDDLIPDYVAQITDVDYNMMDGTHYNLNVVASVCRGKIQKPNLVAMKQPDINYDSVVLRLEYYSGVHKCTMDLEIPDEAYHDSMLLQQAIELLWIKAYEKAPMLTPDLSYMRYTEGILNGGSLHNGGYAAPKPDPYFSGSLAKPAQKGYGGKDSRVDELPGVKERVKNPVTGSESTLERVIINLNDQHKWTREQIADWLETLDIDITFKTKETNEQD